MTWKNDRAGNEKRNHLSTNICTSARNKKKEKGRLEEGNRWASQRLISTGGGE